MGYGKWSKKFTMPMIQRTEKLGTAAKLEVMHAIRGVISDLSKEIIARSPFPPESEYSQPYYIYNTVIYGSNGSTPNISVNYGGYKPNVIAGFSTVLAQCSNWKTIPKVITIENATESPKGFPYWHQVEFMGWKNVRAYSPFATALKVVATKYSDSFIVYSSVALHSKN